MKEQLAREEWGQDVPTTDWDYKSQPRVRQVIQKNEKRRALM